MTHSVPDSPKHTARWQTLSNTMHNEPNSSFPRFAVCHLCSHSVQSSPNWTTLMPYDSSLAIDLVPKNKIGIMYLPCSASMNNIQKPPNHCSKRFIPIVVQAAKGKGYKAGRHWRSRGCLPAVRLYKIILALLFFLRNADWYKSIWHKLISTQEMNSKNIASYFCNDSRKCNIVLLDCDLWLYKNRTYAQGTFKKVAIFKVDF